MKSKIIVIVAFFAVSCAYSQNLVPNPSFENRVTCDIYGDCPTAPVICIAEFWSSARGIVEYYNSCSENINSPFFGYNIGSFSVPHNVSGNQNAVTGNAYAGILTHLGYNPNNSNEREWLKCKLVSPLVIGEKYYINFKVSLADSANCATNNIGVLFSTNTIYQEVYIPLNNFAHFKTDEIIQDTTNWTFISGSFIADSAYNYMIIGNFFDYSLTDSIFYTDRPIGQIFSHSSGCYAYYYIDDIYVSKDSLINNITLNNEQYLKLFPNPATEFINLTISNIITLPVKLILYDITGYCLKTYIINSYNSVINILEFNSGIYNIQLLSKNKIYNQKLIINH
ncbi:MAG TPA: hypothetical protein DDX39_12635 [Bacteroidales bacterium]|nr:MAG: hypothetical protein A2W98_05630 [Bacteroidetes bacterium GWF2_33_38]HBF89479.1 hypothetical protein [Bacteroidales bacterium]